MNEIRTCLKKYFGFAGRASLKEFWKWCFSALAGMSAMQPSVPVVWQAVIYAVTALVGFVFICLFCKPSI